MNLSLKILEKFLYVFMGFLVVWVLIVGLGLIPMSIFKVQSIDFLSQLIKFEKSFTFPLSSILLQYFPMQLHGYDLLPFIKILIALIACSYSRVFIYKIEGHFDFINQRETITAWLKDAELLKGDPLFEALEKKMQELDHSNSKSDKEQLLIEIHDLKEKMETLDRCVTFLSVDIVDSVGIKGSEDKTMVQLDFLSYKKLVQEIFRKNQCIKSAWTPDGVMVCFREADEAALAGQEILMALLDFNIQNKHIKKDFIVRIGANTGRLCFDERMPLEEMTSQVIDVAGHMQKHAEHSSVAISEESYNDLIHKEKFKNANRKVDDHQVYECVVNDLK